MGQVEFECGVTSGTRLSVETSVEGSVVVGMGFTANYGTVCNRDHLIIWDDVMLTCCIQSHSLFFWLFFGLGAGFLLSYVT
jgi:hypothetical protein